MKKLLLVMGLTATINLSTFATPALAGSHNNNPNANQKINNCHQTSSATNPWEAVRVDTEAFDGQDSNDHTLHGDFEYFGPVNPHNDQPLKPEGDDWCEDNQPGDVCDNIAGLQTTIPEGHQNQDGVCTEIETVDLCLNLDGVQETLPEGYEFTSETTCNLIEVTIDVCLNLEGDQTSLPEGYQFADNGDCVEIPVGGVDLCDNLEGEQTEIPQGYELDQNGDCVLIDTDEPEEDVCLNLNGVQESLPNGYEFADNGDCVVITSTQPTDKTEDDPSPTASEVGEVLAVAELPQTGSDIAWNLILSLFASGTALKVLARKKSEAKKSI